MKDKLLNIKNIIINFIKYNRQFCAFVVLSLLCTTLIRVFTHGNIFAFQPFVFDLALILIMGSFGFFYKPQKQFGYFLSLMIFYTIIAIVNTIYYAFYNSFASISLLTALGQVKDVKEAAFDQVNVWQFFYLIFPITFYLVHSRLLNRDYFNFVAKFEKGKKLFVRILLTGLVFLIMCGLTLSFTAFSRLAKQWNREYIVDKFGMVTYQLNDFINTLKPTITSWFGYDVAFKNFLDYFEENTIKPSNNEYTNIYNDKNLIFIHMESLSSILIDLEINGQMITPHLNKLYNEGMAFTNFYPQIGVGTSSDTEFTINTSLMPVTQGTVFVSFYDRTFISIPNLLKEKGYYTFSMHGNKASMWNRANMHPNLGYMDFYSSTSFEIDEKIGLGISDKSFFKQAIPILEEIEKNNQKYMGTIITLTNHTPFEFNELFTDLDLTYQTDEEVYDYLEDTKLGDYLVSSHYADEALGEFIEMVNNSDCFNDTVFIFYGDHDPRFSAREFLNFYNFDQATGKELDKDDENYVAYDYYANELNRKTPLIIWQKNAPIRKKIDYYLGTIDVLPTVGNMIGIYNKYALGKDIFEVKYNNIVTFPNGNFLSNKIYYNSSKEEYRVISLDETLSQDYIENSRAYAETLIELSNGIIVHDLIKKDRLNGGEERA